MHRVRRVAAILLLLSAAAVGGFAVTESSLFEEAQSYYDAGNYLLALESFTEFAQRFPLAERVADAQYLRAVSLFRLERYRESLDLFEEIGRRYRSTRYFPYTYFFRGMALYRLGDYQGALGALEQFLFSSRSSPELSTQALLTKGQAELALKDYRGASRDLEALRQEYASSPEAARAVVPLAYSYLQEGRTRELLELAEQGDGGLLPAGQRDLFRLYTAEALWEEGRREEAETAYGELLQAQERIAAVAYRRLYLAAEARGDLGRMQALIGQAETRFAGAPEALRDLWVQVGVASYQQDRLDLAQYFFEKVWNLANRKGSGETVPLYLAEIRIRRGELDQAAAVLEEYLSLEPVQAEGAQLRLADVRLLQRDYADAAQGYARFMERYPQSPRYGEAGYLLAYVELRRGNLDKSLSLGRSLLADPRGAPARQNLYRLLVAVHKRQGNRREAVSLLREYVSLYPQDLGARIDLLKQLFAVTDYTAVAAEARKLEEEVPDLESRSLYAALMSRYLRGLAEISRKNYSGASRALSGVSAEKARQAGLEEIAPYTLYYHAWALYRQGRFREARDELAALLSGWPTHALFPQGLFLAGWCSFSLKEYGDAAGYFARLAKMSSELSAKAAFLQGRSLANLEDLDGASGVFRNLFLTQPRSPFADDALFEYAGVLAQRDRWGEAVSAYGDLVRNYPDSPLAQEALYKRGEVFGAAGQFQKAKEAYLEYRQRFPKGRLVDASLYWGGIAAYQLGEKFEAVLHWERLAEGYPDSPFLPDALRRTAELYAERGDHARAVKLYTTLAERFPEEARVYNVAQRLDELRYEQRGLSDREAVLSSAIGREGGAKSAKGREAMIELARMYIYEGSGRMELAHDMLQAVAAKEEPVTAAQARYLIGEYFFRKNDPVRAAQEFLGAAYANPRDRDLMAASIYRAAEMMYLAGRKPDLRELVGRLEQHFPDSPWTAEGRKLTEGGSR
jgi:TolA-binding protein